MNTSKFDVIAFALNAFNALAGLCLGFPKVLIMFNGVIAIMVLVSILWPRSNKGD